MIDCSSTDLMFPMVADVFYPDVKQTAYGNVSKEWSLDRTVLCNFSSAGTAFKEEVKPNVAITQDTMLVGRTKQDLRLSERQDKKSMTNIVISNIRDKNCNPIYTETSGARAGLSTIFEIATVEPYVGPFGGIEYYKIVLRRSENQAVDV